MDLGAIKEQDLVIGKMNPDQERALVSKCITIWDNYKRFWEPRHELGRQCWEYLVGNVLSDSEKADYALQHAIVLQLPELVGKVNALEGMQIAGRRNGIIVPIGGEDAPDTEVINHLIKNIQRENQYSQESTAAFTNALVTSFPSFCWFERTPRDDMTRKLEVFTENWDAVLPDPYFRKHDLSDADRIIRMRVMSLDKAVSKWPERAELLKSKFKYKVQDFSGIGMTATDRETVFQSVSSSCDKYEKTGLLYIVEHNFFVYKRHPVWLSPYSTQPEILPEDWSKEEVEKWKMLHPNYQLVEMPVRLLWKTTHTANGVLLGNEMHWLQEGEFPCEAYIPRIWNGQFHGLIEFLRGSLKGSTVAQIERIQSIRLSNNNVTKIRDGSVVNPKGVLNELSRPGGVVVVSKTSAMEDVQRMENGTEQRGWKELHDDLLESISRLSVDRNFEGGSQSSQESGRAVGMRIAQTQVKYSPYMSTYNFFHHRCTRKQLLCIPYVFTEPETIRFVTKEGQVGSVNLNEPEEWSVTTGAVTRVKYNLCGARFDYLESEADDSVTAKDHELSIFNEVLANLSKVQDISAWPPLLMEMPNRMAQEFGKRLQKTLEAQSQQGPGVDAAKVGLNLRGDDLLHNPPALAAAIQAGLLPPEFAQSSQGQGMEPQNAIPFPQGQAGQSMPQVAASVA